jgi:integrase
MAYLYKRKGSPYWWIGRAGQAAESTKLRHADPGQSRLAQRLLAQVKQEEKEAGGRDHVRFDKWVGKFIEERYGNHQGNHKSYTNRWVAISAFFSERGIVFPNHLTAQHCWDYVFWRTAPDGKRRWGVRSACKNTALEEIKFLRMLMRHAVALGYAVSNPAETLRMRWEGTKEKPEILDIHMPIIWKALETEPEWMGRAFQIGYYTGCRLAETQLPMRCIDLARREIHFPVTKGDKPFTVPMPSALVPFFTELASRGEQWACRFPSTNLASVEFCHLFKRLGMPYCFHCLRVSFISRCIRAGLAEGATMRLVNHCSVEIHRLYQRYRASDLRAAVDAIPHHTLGMTETQGAPSASQGPPGE